MVSPPLPENLGNILIGTAGTFEHAQQTSISLVECLACIGKIAVPVLLKFILHAGPLCALPALGPQTAKFKQRRSAVQGRPHPGLSMFIANSVPTASLGIVRLRMILNRSKSRALERKTRLAYQ